MNVLNSRLTNSSLNDRAALLILKRFKFKAKCKEQCSPCNKALKHFDDFYKGVFAEKWPSVRLGLLTKQKYFAVINNFGEIQKTEEYLQNQGAFDLRVFLEVQKNLIASTNKENKAQKKNETALEDIIQQQLHLEEKKETEYLHPEGMEFKAKVDFFNQQNDENKNADDYYYQPEDARTSLESDLKKSEIDKTRLILPDSSTDLTLLDNFIPATQLRGTEGFIAESDYYKYYTVKSTSSLSIEEDHEIDFPENLKVYTFDRGETLDFPEPTKCHNNVYSYLKVDGGDLLAALALDVQPENTVLDMCSTSRNISYCVFQTLRSKMLLCTEDKKDQIHNLFNEYLYSNESLWDEMLFVTSSSVSEVDFKCLFDRVLVDVPSTFDKTALFNNTDNMFHITKLKERLKLPEVQCSLLLKGMELVRPGGTVVYTTSTLSPVQNEGVVNEALNKIWDRSKVKFTIKKLSPALQHMSFFFNFGDYLNLKFGTLVVPFLPVNFGPRYICKMVRNKEQ